MEGYAPIQLIANKLNCWKNQLTLKRKNRTEEVMGLFDEIMYGTSVPVILFIHSCTCSNKKSCTITFQKKNFTTGSILLTALCLCVCLVAICSRGKLMLT